MIRTSVPPPPPPLLPPSLHLPFQGTGHVWLPGLQPLTGNMQMKGRGGGRRGSQKSNDFNLCFSASISALIFSVFKQCAEVLRKNIKNPIIWLYPSFIW